MFKTIIKPVAFIVLCAIVFVNCSKDDKTESKSKMTLLTQKDWVITKFEEKTNNNPYVDDFPNWDACNKDDRYVFRTNNTYELNEGPTKCDAADPQVYETGVWAFAENETKITSGGESSTIEQLDENTLILATVTTFGPDTYYLRVTFGH